MMWEYFAAAGILLFALSQLMMAWLSRYAYPVVEQWKKTLSNSHSMLARLALIIYF